MSLIASALPCSYAARSSGCSRMRELNVRTLIPRMSAICVWFIVAAILRTYSMFSSFGSHALGRPAITQLRQVKSVG